MTTENKAPEGAQRPESMRCAGCDISNGCPEYCRCKTAAPVATERQAFEAHIKKDCGDLRTFGSGLHIHYRNSAVNNAWTGWHARAALAAPAPQALDVERLIRECLPGGYSCDPQAVADSIREWSKRVAPQAAPIGYGVTYDGRHVSYVYKDMASAAEEAKDVGGTARAIAVFTAPQAAPAALTFDQAAAIFKDWRNGPLWLHMTRGVERAHGIPAPQTKGLNNDR